VKKHRGLSSIIGSVFLFAVLIGALSYVAYTMNVLGNFSESLLTEEKRQKEKQGEQFEISSLSSSGSKIDGVVKNTGDVPVDIKTVWIEETGKPDSVKKLIVNKTIAPGDKINLINSINFNLNSTKGYTLKMISGRGQIQTSYLNSVSSVPLFMNVNIIPNTVSTGFPATILFTVVNNMSNNNILYNVTPKISVSSTTGLASYSQLSGPSPKLQPILKPGDVATFEYIYTISGEEGQFVNFGLSLQNGYLINANKYQSVNATAEIKDVEIAISAGSSITSLGLETVENQLADILLLHTDTFGIPSSMTGTQLQNRDPDTAGTTFNTYSNNPRIFIGANMTSQLIAYPGVWNASLQYYSNATSVNISPPSFAYFFECDDCPSADQTAESIGNIDAVEVGKGHLKKGGTDTKNRVGFPTWRDPTNPSYGDGPDKDGYYNFAGTGNWLQDDWKVENGGLGNIGSPPDTDAVWIRVTSSTIANYMPVIRFGDADDSKNPADIYEISIGSASGTAADKGKIRFKLDDTVVSPGTGSATCMDSTHLLYQAPYLGKWQHIVAVRESNGQCNLYLNGSLVAGPTGTASNSMDGIKKVGIGTIDFADSDSLNTLKADVATWMHWNNKALTAAQAKELFYTNYGKNGTRVHLTINKTDTNGGNNVNLLDIPNYSLPFYDPAKKSTGGVSYFALYSDANSAAINKFSRSNVTGTLASQTTFSVGDRLVLGIKTDSTTQNLPIYIKVDDIDFTGTTLDNSNSFLQSSTTSVVWPGFLSFATNAQVTLNVFNNGPDGLWFTFAGTRMVLTTIDGVKSYGAMPTKINNNLASPNNYYNTLDSDTDGPYIADQGTASIDFSELHNPPSLNPITPSTLVPAGDYLASIYLSGYDEKGTAFLRTVDLGLVNIHN